jgi:hypothetical protein
VLNDDEVIATAFERARRALRSSSETAGSPDGPAAGRDRLDDDADQAVGVALHDLGRATDELVDRFTKLTVEQRRRTPP